MCQVAHPARVFLALSHEAQRSIGTPPPGWEANVLQVRPPLSILSSFLDNSPVPNCTPGGDLGWREAGPPSEHFVKLP